MSSKGMWRDVKGSVGYVMIETLLIFHHSLPLIVSVAYIQHHSYTMNLINFTYIYRITVMYEDIKLQWTSQTADMRWWSSQ